MSFVSWMRACIDEVSLGGGHCYVCANGQHLYISEQRALRLIRLLRLAEIEK